MTYMLLIINYHTVAASILPCISVLYLSAVQLLHKLSIHADDGPMKLMKVSGALCVSSLLPFGCRNRVFMRQLGAWLYVRV